MLLFFYKKRSEPVPFPRRIPAPTTEAADIQRFVELLGYELLCAHTKAAPEQPAWLLAVHKVRRRCGALRLGLGEP